MKKTACFLLSMYLTLVLCAASGAPAPLTDGDFAFALGDVVYALGDAAAPLVAAINEACGAPMTVTEAESCMFSGKDREYENDCLIIGTYPIGAGGADVLETVMVFSDAYQTARGARVGMTRDEIVALYGSDFILDYDQMIYRVRENGSALVFGVDLTDGGIAFWALMKNTSN